MAGYAFFNRHRCKSNKYFLCCVSLLFLLWGCGGDPSDQGTADKISSASSDTGSASFAIQWHGVSAKRASALVRQAIDDCGQAGVESITCEVYDESHNPIASGGPWNCSDHQGTIEGIPAGSKRMFAVLGWSAAGGGGDTVYQGQTGNTITIDPRVITDAGTIDAYPFVPQLSDPADGQSVTANAFSLTWDSVATANQYLILVSEDSGFTAPVIDAQTSETTYSPKNLAASAAYYWKIRSIDIHGNESADSEVWNFNTNAIESCGAPVLDPINDQQVDENATLTFTIDATDADGSSLTFSHSSLPDGATFDKTTRRFRWTPDFGTAGNYPVTFSVCDDCPDGSLCDSEEITITVGDVCRPPKLDPIGDRQVDENDTLTFTIDATDADGGSLTFSHSSLPDGATFDKTTRRFRWTPDFGTAGNYPVTFSVCDDCPDGSLCDSEKIAIAVGDVCRPPKLTDPGDQQVDEDDNLTFTLSASDQDGGTLTFDAKDLPEGATFDKTTRRFSWTPDFGDAGNYLVTFSVCDDCPDGSLCDEKKVTITVGKVCRPPELTVPGDQRVYENNNLTFTVNASDLDGGTLTFDAKDLPVDAKFDKAARRFVWTPRSGSAGKYDVTFRVCDDCPDGSLCDEKKVSIEVIPLPDAPILSTPIDGKVVDNGCGDKSDPIEWDFEWKEVPGAVQYQIYVIHTGSALPVIDDTVSGAAYHYSDFGYVAETNRYEWTWHVRAMNKDQQWSNWSEWGYFNVEPLNTDCMVYGILPIQPIN